MTELIASGAGREFACKPKHLTAHIDKLRNGIARAFVYYRLVMSKRHLTIMPQRTLSLMVNIAQFSKDSDVVRFGGGPSALSIAVIARKMAFPFENEVPVFALLSSSCTLQLQPLGLAV